jgi:hypothetical protein
VISAFRFGTCKVTLSIGTPSGSAIFEIKHSSFRRGHNPQFLVQCPLIHRYVRR